MTEIIVRVQTDRMTSMTQQGELVRSAERVFGAELTRIIATGRRPSSAPRSSSAELKIGRRGESRLRAALDIATQLGQLEAKSTIQAWFVGKNPLLGDRAPALVLADDPDAVRRAARHFLANG